MKMFEFQLKNLIVICFKRSNQQYSSIGSDNGLVPTRRQAIIWTNDGLITNAHVSLGLNELTKRGLVMPWVI